MNVEEQEKALIALLTRVMDAPLQPIRQSVSESLQISQRTYKELVTAHGLLVDLLAASKSHSKTLRSLEKWQENFDDGLPQTLQDALEALKAKLEDLQSELARRDQRNQAAAEQAHAGALAEVAAAQATLSAAQQESATTQRAEAQQHHRDLSQVLIALQANIQQVQAASVAALSGQQQKQATSLNEGLQQLLQRQADSHNALQAELALQRARVQWVVALSGASLVVSVAGLAAWALKLV